MTYEEALELRRRWGNRRCHHPRVEPELFSNGKPSGDRVCTTCGELFLKGCEPQGNHENAVEQKRNYIRFPNPFT
jgi:hypothetical protein